MLSDIRTVENVLQNWGRWAYINRGLSLEYPSIEPHERLRRTSGLSADITDDEAMLVDGVVSTLVEDSRKIHDAIALHYVVGLNHRQAAKVLNAHHRTVQDWIAQGRMYVKAGLRFTEK